MESEYPAYLQDIWTTSSLHYLKVIVHPKYCIHVTIVLAVEMLSKPNIVVSFKICKLAAFPFGCILIPTSWSESICNKTRGPHKKIMTMSEYFSLLQEAVRQIKIRTIAYRKQQSPGSLHRQHWYCDTWRYMLLPLLTDSMDSCPIGLCEPAPTSALLEEQHFLFMIG
jgi:hypothetical protein